MSQHLQPDSRGPRKSWGIPREVFSKDWNPREVGSNVSESRGKQAKSKATFFHAFFSGPPAGFDAQI